MTKDWLKRNYETLENLETSCDSNNMQLIINKIMIASYMEILLWDQSNPENYPETLLMDVMRFQALKEKVNIFISIGCVLLVTFATVGPTIQGLEQFRDTLKDHLLVLITNGSNDPEEIKNQLVSVSVQVVDEVQKCLEKHGFDPMDDTKKKSLETQIIEVAKSDNRIRKVVQRRITEFIEGVLSSPTASPMQIPPGLSSLQKELSAIAGQFMRLVAHNRAVFQEYYADIIKNLTLKR